MSAVVDVKPRIEAAVRHVPPFPVLAAPGAALAAALLARSFARRRQARPQVYWSLSIGSGNRIAFRPTLAPRFGSLFIRGRRFGGRRRGPAA